MRQNIQFLIIFSLVIVAKTLHSNIYFTFLNKTDYNSRTEILYLLNPQPNAVIPFELTKYMTILMGNSISNYDWKFYGGYIIFINKSNREVLLRRSLLKVSQGNKTTLQSICSDEENYFKYSLKFLATDIIENITNCHFDLLRMFSYITIHNYSKGNENLTVNGKIYPSRLDGYLNISEKPFNFKCINERNLIFIIGAFVTLALIIFIKLLMFFFKNSSRVDIESEN